MNFQTVNASSSPEVQMNENFETIDYSSVYGKRQPVTSGLTWGYYGGRWGGFSVSAGTFTLTDGSTNYLVTKRSDGVHSASTSNTNWNNTAQYARVYLLTTSGGVVTATEDHRAGPDGIHGIANVVDVLHTKDKIYPGTDAAATQTAAGIYAGTGVPNNSNGSNGDFYFRSDGGSGTTIYQRRSGSWVGIV